jgi:hypothetical protein
MAKLILEGKEVNLKNDLEEVKRFVESKGGRKLSTSEIQGKSIEQLSVDPLTVGIIAVGVGSYVWYRLTTKEQLEMVKKSIN